MSIQNRRGAEKDFDATKMLPGEFAVTTDGTKKVYVAFAPGDAREFAFKDQIPIVGNVTPAEVQNAVDNYLTENPVQAGATDEQATQIERNRKNSELNKEEIAKTKNNLAQLSNPNIFINGNFQIWTNGESFQVQNKDTEVVTPFITADKWYVESVDSAEELNVNKVNDGLYISSSTPQECAIYQLLDDETYNAIKYKTLTLSYEYTQPYSAEDTSVHYETHKEVKQIVAEETLAWEFANNNAIRLPVGTVGGAGCTLHWVKLEVGELDTPCIPDSKDAIICKLENEVTKLNGNYIHNTWNNGYVTYEKTKNKVHVHGYIPINAKTGSISLPYKNYDNDPRVIPMIGMNADFTIIQGYGCGIVQRGGDTLEIQMSGATTFACCDFTYYTD